MIMDDVPDKLTEVDLLYLVNAASDKGYCQIVEEFDPGVDGVILENEQAEDPEKEAIKHDLWGRLSQEARAVARLIFDAPAEMLTPIKGDITKNSVWNYMYAAFGERRAKMVFAELSNFVKEAY
jgi:hypothetical protein